VGCGWGVGGGGGEGGASKKAGSRRRKGAGWSAPVDEDAVDEFFVLFNHDRTIL
jgi:hypothetical protein